MCNNYKKMPQMNKSKKLKSEEQLSDRRVAYEIEIGEE
jgi:hypothetical protein